MLTLLLFLREQLEYKPANQGRVVVIELGASFLSIFVECFKESGQLKF